MTVKTRKPYAPRPHVVITTEATVYRRDTNGRLVAVETLPAQWKQYNNRR